jgi:single-strand DNA-binding protein
MARGVNKVIAIGNLGKDPETRYVPSGAAVTNFSIAVSESWKDKQTGEQKERTEWINVEVWGNAAEACQKYLQKGSQCYVEGKMQTDKWEKDGVTRYTTKVRADTVQFLGSKGGGSGQRDEKPGAPPPGGAQGEFDDDIPF